MAPPLGRNPRTPVAQPSPSSNGLVARQPLLVACGVRGGLRLTVSPLADGPPATRVPLSPLGDPHAPLSGLNARTVGRRRTTWQNGPGIVVRWMKPMTGRGWKAMTATTFGTPTRRSPPDVERSRLCPLPASGCGSPTVVTWSTRMASWWTAIWGYRHPALDDAVQDQLGRMSHVMFGGLTHAPAIDLAERLVAMAPQGLESVFFADSGSVSVEVALKTAIQYQRNAGHPEKARFLALTGGYHGDTFGAMSVCDPVGGMHHLFADALPQQLFAPRPPAGPGVDPAWETEVREMAERNGDQIAAIICEPVAQGAGGMWFYDPGYVRVLREVCDEHGPCSFSTRSRPVSAAPGHCSPPTWPE